MKGIVQGDALRGNDWDKLRELRLLRKGDGGLVLDASRIPVQFRDLLPYISLLATGEDGLQHEFWAVLSSHSRGSFYAAMEQVPDRVDKIRASVQNAPYSAEIAQLSYLADTYESFVALEPQ
jgi:hypothetical protein